jgi:hypothetical protein
MPILKTIIDGNVVRSTTGGGTRVLAHPARQAVDGSFGITGGLTPSPAPNAITEAFLTTLNPNSSLQ